MQKPVALVFAILLAFGAIVVVPGASAVSIDDINQTSDGAAISSGGQNFTVTGSDFSEDVKVSFKPSTGDAIPAFAVARTSSSSLIVTTPALPAGTYQVIVTNPDGSATFSGFQVSQAATPTLTSLSTNSGSVNGGTQIVITGTRFASFDLPPIVTIGGTAALIVARTDSTGSGADTLTVYSPPHAAGVVDLRVANQDGAGATLTGGYTYVSGGVPTIGTVTVSGTAGSNGRASPVVTITGTNFAGSYVDDRSPAGPEEFGAMPSVSFGGTPGRVVSVSPSGTSLTAELPPHAAGAVDVSVQNPGGQTATKTGALTYTSDPAPSIDDLSDGGVDPRQGAGNGGTPVEISGSGFHFESGNPNAAMPRVLFGTKEAKVLERSATLLLVMAPTQTALGTVAIQVINPDGQSDTINGAYTYVDSVAVTEVTVGTQTNTPVSVSENGGTTITIKGSGFSTSPAPLVFVDNATATVRTASATQLTVVAPRGAVGPAHVRVVNADGRQASLANAFNYATAAAPTVTSFSPATGTMAGGTPVTITGTGFGVKPVVTFDDVAVPPANVTFDPATGSLKVITPAGDVGANRFVNVTNPDGQKGTRQGWSYTDLDPTITSISPALGPDNGGTNVTITGTNFGPDSEVSFGSDEAVAVVWVSATTLRATAPQHTVSSGKNEKVEVVVTTTAGSTPSSTTPTSNDFTFTTLVPEITFLGTSSAPKTSGTTLGRETMTITGKNFTAQSKAFFGSIEAESTTFTNNLTLSVKTPAHAAGAFPVTVRNVDLAGAPARDVSNAKTFTFTTPADSAPVVTSVSPATGPLFGGTNITVTGLNFANKLTVTLCNAVVPASSVTPVSPTSVKFVLPARTPAGSCTLSIKNADNQTGSLSNALRYLPAMPTIWGLSGTSGHVTEGSTNGGSDVLIQGSVPVGTAVSFGSVAAYPTATQGGSSYQVYSPPNSAGETSVFLYDKEGQIAGLFEAFTYGAAAPPRILQAFEAAGPALGGNTIMIKGSGFPMSDDPDVPVLPVVTLGTLPATRVEVLDQNTLLAVTPSHVQGITAVKVTNPDTQSHSRGNYTFLGAGGAVDDGGSTPGPTDPDITGIAPNQGLPAGGTTVVITGTNFANPASVTFGGTAATNVTVVSATQITAKTPAHAPGPVEVVVTVGTPPKSASEPNGFTYTANPTDPDPDPDTDTDSDSDSSSTGVTVPLTPAAIKNANDRIEVTVTREGDDNVISWDLPSPPAGQTIMGVQVWRSNSPYTLLQTIPSSSDAFDDGTFRDTSSEARATSKYLVTMYYGATAALGLFTASTAPDTEDYPGVASVDAQDTDDDSGGLPTWAIVLIALGILFLVVLVAVLIARGRNRDGQQAAAQGYAWQEEGEAKAAEGEWQPPAEVHQARCPACATSFTATGQKPIVTVCPGCGKKGILR